MDAVKIGCCDSGSTREKNSALARYCHSGEMVFQRDDFMMQELAEIDK